VCHTIGDCKTNLFNGFVGVAACAVGEINEQKGKKRQVVVQI